MFSALLLLLFLLMLEYLMHDEVAGVPAAMTIFCEKGSLQWSESRRNSHRDFVS